MAIAATLQDLFSPHAHHARRTCVYIVCSASHSEKLFSDSCSNARRSRVTRESDKTPPTEAVSGQLAAEARDNISFSIHDGRAGC